MQFNDLDINSFELKEEDIEEAKAMAKNSRLRCWVGTWNNPTMSDEEFLNLLTDYENEDIIQYAIFQRERGEEKGTIHFQFFVNFKSPIRFTRVKDLLPHGCHFKPMYSNQTRCKNYCSKSDTRVSGPYEIGEFEEERQRTDLSRAIKMINDGFSLQEIFETFPTQYLMYGKRFETIYNQQIQWKYEKECRNLEIVYIYGPERVGKTSFVEDQFELGDLFVVDNYDNYWFTGYTNQKAILLDEFMGQVKPITRLNKLLEPWPQKMNAKGTVVQACFEKVFIVANYSLKEIYKKEQEEQTASYNAFKKRINKIIRFDEKGNQHIEKETIFEDIPKEEQKYKGMTKRIKTIIEYDSYGKSKIVYDRENKEYFQEELVELSEEEKSGLPF